MEINIDNLNINEHGFNSDLYNNILHINEKLVKLNYIANKSNLNEEQKNNLKKIIKNIKGGYISKQSIDINSFIMLSLYKNVNQNLKKKVHNYINNKITQKGGSSSSLSSVTEIISNLTKIKNSIPLSNKASKAELTEIIDNITSLMDSQHTALSSGVITANLAVNPLVPAILKISENLKDASTDEIANYVNEYGIDNIFTYYRNHKINTHDGQDINKTISFLKMHTIYASDVLKNIVDSIESSGSDHLIYKKSIVKLDEFKRNTKETIKSITKVTANIKIATEKLRSDDEYKIYPIDFKIVNGIHLGNVFKSGPIKYSLDSDLIKIQFKKVPGSVNSIMDEIKKKVNRANKKIPGIGNNIITMVKDVNVFRNLVDNLSKSGSSHLFFQSGGSDTDVITPKNLLSVDDKEISFANFADTVSTRKLMSEKISEASSLLDEMKNKVAELVEAIEDFNLNESREHWYSYVLSNLALNSNVNKTYKYISFGILEFYKSIITTIWKKIDIDRSGEDKLASKESRKYLFFYHYHYKIIKKLYLFFEKFDTFKNLSILYPKNSFIEISECTGKAREYLNLLNIYKYLLDDFYSKVGLGNTTSNVTLYLRINDFANERLVLGKQFGTFKVGADLGENVERTVNGNTVRGDWMYNTYIGHDAYQDYMSMAFQPENQIAINDAIKDVTATYKNRGKNVSEKLESIYRLIIENPKFEPRATWQVYQTAGTAISNVAKNDGNWDNYYNANNKIEKWPGISKDNTELVVNEIPQLDSQEDFINHVYYKPANPNGDDQNLFEEREKKLFYLLNRQVPTINDNEYRQPTKETNDEKFTLEFIPEALDIAKGNPEFRFITDNHKKERPLLSNVLYFPLLPYLTPKCRDLLGLKSMYDKLVGDKTSNNTYGLIDNGAKTCTLGNIKININGEELTVDFGNMLNLYKDYFCDTNIIKILVLGFIPYSKEIVDTGTNKIKFINNNYQNITDEQKGESGKTDTYKSLRSSELLNYFKIKSFKFDPNIPVGTDTNKYKTLVFAADTSSFEDSAINDGINGAINVDANSVFQNVSNLVAFHYYLRSNFNTLYFEPTKDYRDNSEIIFTSSADNKSLKITSVERCKRLLDRHINEDDINALKSRTAIDKVNFNHVFSTDKSPDNESVGMFMSIPSKLSMGNGFMLLTFGYSGTGKTFTIFGNKDRKERGVLQTALNEVDYDETDENAIMFRCYEMYGVGLPYSSYWYDDIGVYNPKRTEMIIHHRFEPGENLTYRNKSLHIFDTAEQRKLYLNNVNIFFPDIGNHDFDVVTDSNGVKNAQYITSETVPNLNDSYYVPSYEYSMHGDDSLITDNEKLSYCRYSKDKGRYFNPRVYSTYFNNNTDKSTIIKDDDLGKCEDDTTNSKLSGVTSQGKPSSKFKQKHLDNSTYVSIKPKQIAEFEGLIEQIDINRKEPLRVNTSKIIYNKNETLPSEYDHIRRIKATANNPESSRSIIFYEFVIKLKTPQQVRIEDENGNSCMVWRHYVNFLIVDLPGQEDIKSSFVEKGKYNILGEHTPQFISGPLNNLTDMTIPRKFSFKSDLDANNYFGTSENSLVYEYNDYMQRLVKASVFMNPLFTFMSYLKNPTNNGVNTFTDNMNSKILMSTIYSGGGNGPLETAGNVHLLNATSTSARDNILNIYRNPGLGSDMYKNFPFKSIQPLIEYQISPLNFILKNALEHSVPKSGDLDDKIGSAVQIPVTSDTLKDRLLAPYEGYMINENVMGLITFLKNKKVKRSGSGPGIEKNYEQQSNFANRAYKQPLYRDIEGSGQRPNIKELFRNKIKLEGPNYESIRMCDNISPLIDNNIRVIEIKDVLKLLSIYIYVLVKDVPRDIDQNPPGKYFIKNAVAIDSIASSDIKDNYFTGNDYAYMNNMNIDKISNSSIGPLKYDGILYNGCYVDGGSSIASNIQQEISNLANIPRKLPTNFRPLQNITFSKSTYDNGDYDYPGLKSFLPDFYLILMKYIHLIDIFLLYRQLRGLDNYFRINVLPQTNLLNNEGEYKSALNRLKDFYNFYINDFIYFKDSSVQYSGIYDNKRMFRNGKPNDFLSKFFTLYRNKNETNTSKYIISGNGDLDSDNPTLTKLNTKPLIFDYLEPYQDFFNSYSLLYVISNNDPNIKCYKQIDLLESNRQFINTIVDN